MVAAILAELAQEYPEVPKWIFLTTIVGAALAWITILLRVQVTGSCLLQSANEPVLPARLETTDTEDQ